MNYFEWLKNLEHIGPGKRFRRWEEKSKHNLLDVIARATGMEKTKFSSQELLEGATETDIVYAGVEEVMSTAADEVIETSLKRNVDLRTAAYINSITKLD